MKIKQFGRIAWLASLATPAIAAVAALAYLAFWPVAIEPSAWRPSANAGYTGVHQVNHKLAGLNQVKLQGGQEGPEFLLAHEGHLYTGLGNGDVVKMDRDGQNQVVVTNTGGRPLGLDVDDRGRLLVADPIKGLLRIEGQGADSKIEPLLTTVSQGGRSDAIRYADAVKVSSDGVIWLTDASTRFGARDNGGTFEASVLDILEHSCTGRLIALAPTGESRVAMDGLCFPNGIEFSLDGKSMFLSETGAYRVIKVDLAKLQAGQKSLSVKQALEQGWAKVILDNLPGYPDNLSRGENGRLWTGLTKPRSAVADFAGPYPFIRSLTMRLPRALWPVPKPYGHLIAFDESGKVLDDLQDPTGAYPETTAAIEVDGKLFVQSLHAHSLGWMAYRGHDAKVAHAAQQRSEMP